MEAFPGSHHCSSVAFSLVHFLFQALSGHMTGAGHALMTLFLCLVDEADGGKAKTQTCGNCLKALRPPGQSAT